MAVSVSDSPVNASAKTVPLTYTFLIRALDAPNSVILSLTLPLPFIGKILLLASSKYSPVFPETNANSLLNVEIAPTSEPSLDSLMISPSSDSLLKSATLPPLRIELCSPSARKICPVLLSYSREVLPTSRLPLLSRRIFSLPSTSNLMIVLSRSAFSSASRTISPLLLERMIASVLFVVSTK